MGIIGYNITSVTADRKLEMKRIENMDVNSTVKISSVTEREITLPEKSEALGIGFEFTTEYRPDIANFKVVGEVLYSDKTSKNIAKSWGKDKKLPEDMDIEIKNFIFRKCLTLGVNLSEELQLPPPVIFPMISPKKDEEKTKYIG